MMRQVQNAWDGKYVIVGGSDNKTDRESKPTGGFRETESRVVKRLVDMGLAIPQTGTEKSTKR
ncbi:MAG: hypothetical protein H7Y38_11735 [Armatimonadetes bacterium]|nr:hypothetical protein [Armatimonadota bacterium]